jgi:hypothetical protein
MTFAAVTPDGRQADPGPDAPFQDAFQLGGGRSGPGSPLRCGQGDARV